MTPPPDLKHALCLKFCSYYKPDRNEELACEGYALIERLMARGMRFDFEATGKPRDRTRDTILAEAMCCSCPFHECDCDFTENRELPPCGGFLLLAQLLAAEKIKIEDIK